MNMIFEADGVHRQAMEVPANIFRQPDWKEHVQHLADRMVSDFARQIVENQWTYRIYLDGVMSVGNLKSDDDLLKEMPKKELLHILTKKIA